ncbi:MAG: S-layer homology domain-containing protein, partial [Clostridiales bacterium]|nr:S-layer homology domain-containing protein [Clostridiales bacterium]
MGVQGLCESKGNISGEAQKSVNITQNFIGGKYMKNLKKLLALVLVAVMVLSFGAISASAAFTDTAASNYKVAIDVLSGIGVINGTTSTTFDPAGTLTREAAAKVIAYMQLGPANAAAIGAVSSSSFTDVEATRWSAPYIEYCVAQGIIGGRGDGTFDPTGTLTTAAYTKLLLCALGYKADAEGLTGPSWAINAATLAVTAGISDTNIGISATAVCNREQAAQLAYKALSATLVQYTGGTTITIGDSTITTGAVRSDVYSPAPSNQNIIAGTAVNGQYSLQFAEKYFPQLTFATGVLNGVYGKFWSNGSTPISGIDPIGVVKATSAKGSFWSYAGLTDASSPFYIGYRANDPVTYYYNDTAAADKGATNVGWPVTTQTLADNITTIQGKIANAGAVTKFIDTNYDGKYDIITVVEKTAKILTAAPTTTTSGSLTYVNLPGTTIPTTTTTTNITYPSDLAKDDVVLYYLSGTHYYVEKATAVSGSITSYTDGSVTINGTTYAIAALPGMLTAYDDISEYTPLIGRPGYTFYTDAFNNLVWAVAPTGAATLTNTVYVSAVDFTSAFGTTTYAAKVVALDGTVSTVNVLKTAKAGAGSELTLVSDSVGGTAGDAIVAAGAMDNGKLAPNLFYTYIKNADGSYNLIQSSNQAPYVTNLAVSGAADAINLNDTSYAINKATANFLSKKTATGDAANWTVAAAGTAVAQTVVGTSNTVFMYYNPILKTYAVYTGVANTPNYGYGGNIYVVNDANGYAVAVVATGGTADTTNATFDKIYVTGSATVTLDALGNNLYTYPAVVNGVTGKTVTSNATMGQLTAGNLYLVKDYDANGNINSAATGLTATTGAVNALLSDLDVVGGTLTVTLDGTVSGSYILNSGVVIFMY